MELETFLEDILTKLVHFPANVQVTRSSDELGVLLSVELNPADMGIVIGKSGETIKAIRHIVRVFGMKNAARCSIKINEPAGSTRIPKTAYTPEAAKVY